MGFPFPHFVSWEKNGTHQEITLAEQCERSMKLGRADNVTIIVEVGSVHDGRFGNTQKLVDLAVQCGVNAINFRRT
jgi:hypothetical protein